MASSSMRQPTGGQSDRDHTTNVSKLPYTPGLDGMRALAVVAVMVYHANSDWLPGGFLGVEVFFVISGYLITLLLIAEHERTDRVNLGQFWLRRARRLLPAVFLMMGMLITYTAFFKDEALGQLRGDVLGGVFYVSNWFQIWVGAGYSDFADFAPLRHLWSLAVEEQFYLVWPLVMALLLARKGRRITDSARWIVLASLLVTVVMAVLHHQGPVQACDITPEAYWQLGDRCISKPDALYLSTITRSGGLLLGAAFAMVWRPYAIMRGPLRHKGPLLDLIAVVGILGLFALNWYLHFMTAEGADPWLFRGGFLLTGITTLMVVAAVTHARANTGRLLGNPVFLWVGTRSYGLYLYHWPIYQVIREQAGIQLKFGEFVIAMAVTAALTEVSYRYVEMPIRRGKAGEWWRRMRSQRDPVPRRIVATAGAIGVAAASFATVNLATAKVQPNEVAQSLIDGQESVTDPFEESPVESGPPTSSADAPPASDQVPNTQAPQTNTTQAPPPSAPEGPGGDNQSQGNGSGRTTTTTATTSTTSPPVSKGTAWAVGDSVMKGAAPELEEIGLKVNAVESRSFRDGLDFVQRLIDNDYVGDVLVIGLGANGPIDQDEMDAMIEAVGDVPNVLLITVFTAGGYPFQYDVGPTNQIILDAAAQHDNITVLDWNEVGLACPGDCYYDGLHLNELGQDYYADQIAKVAGLT